jgi:hypothetical protein
VRRVALVTCRALPEPDPDAAPLLDAVKAAGAEASWQAWNDPSVDWSRFHRAVIRSAWDYHLDLDGFVSWLRRANDATEVLNPPSVVRENVDKAYLGRAPVPAVPTVYAGRGTDAPLDLLLAGKDWGTLVIKPRVSGGSYRTERFGPERRGEAQSFLRALVCERDAMIQPFLPSVEGYGERALVWIDGALTHAVRKAPRFGESGECVSEAVPIAPDEAAFAERALAPYKKELLYARVDVARGEDGALRLMELELVEPSLFLRQQPAALERLAAAIAR